MKNNQLLYHITHVTNLPSISEQGGLQSHLSIQQHELKYHDVANQDVQSRRQKTRIPVGKAGILHDYAPFYFAARSPMLYFLHKQKLQQQEIVYFMTNIQAILDHELSYVFTDGHAIRRLTNFYTDLSDLDKMDWDVMKSQYWHDTNEDMNRKSRRQAEFLVHSHVPLSACLGLAVYNHEAKRKVNQTLEEADFSLPVAVRPHFYY